MNPEVIPAKYVKNILPEFVGKRFRKDNRTGVMILLSIALIVITMAVYWQTGNHQFLNFDDNDYVTENHHVEKGITVQNIIWAFTSVEAANWHPVTWLSHMADVRFYGMNPRGHHLTSVAIHTISALLLFFLLFRLTSEMWQSYFVAALFSLHPLHVESVAWVAERKDVLSAFFCFLTLLIYVEYVSKRKPTLYILTLFTFVLGLMSKPMLVTLPIVMLLIDFWPLDQYRHEEKKGVRKLFGRVIALSKEKTPFFVCSLLSGGVTICVQHNSDAVRSFEEISIGSRLENIPIAYVKYIGKTFWPQDLAVLYPFPLSTPVWQFISSLFILLFISTAAIRVRQQHPYLTAGWFWFLITLLPVIGLLQVGGQAMADRYSYIPTIGLFIMVTWGGTYLVKRLQYRPFILALPAAVVIIVSSVLTWHQLGYWRDNSSLYKHTLQVTTHNFLINYNLGLALQANGELETAIQQYREVLNINPGHAGAHNNLGAALAMTGDLDAAIKEFTETLKIRPNNKSTQKNLRIALEQKKIQEATRK